MNKEDNVDAINFYVKQKQIDEMREYTKDYGRDQFVRALVDQRTEIAYLKQALKEIRKICNSNMVAWDNEGDCGADCCVDGFEILQIIDKYMKEDDKN